MKRFFLHRKIKKNARTSKLSKLTFPARPKTIIQKIDASARTQLKTQIQTIRQLGMPIASNPSYISWLKKRSMLAESARVSLKYSGQAQMWRNSFARPQPRTAVRRASVWYTSYPISQISRENESMLQSLADKDVWHAFREIGIKAIHTGPMKRAGGVTKWRYTASIDGHFDRISNQVDPIFGIDDDYKNLTTVAARYGAIVIDDIIPGHTGKGFDFRLAEMAVDEYPGIYHMIEISPADWRLLPSVPKDRDSVNLSVETEAILKKKKYIIGKLQRVIFYDPDVKVTNWSATQPVKGIDGVTRRWVYLHYFKEGQPTINWLDPTFAGMRLVVGDAIHSIGELGASGLRLDANGLLGLEVNEDETNDVAWSEGHPLSRAANQVVASMVRKLGGFTFQELNMSNSVIKESTSEGADLSYDFTNRAAYHHATATGDTEFLRMTLRSVLDSGIDPASLVHALQNHDELTCEIVNYLNNEDVRVFRNKQRTGAAIRDIVRKELSDALLVGEYNHPFTENGFACTNTSAIAAYLGYSSVNNLSPEQIETIKCIHLLLVKFNAWQPGVFALSGWDLVGALTLSRDEVKDLISDGDTRWMNRGAYDLGGTNPSATESSAGIKKALALYGSLPDQLRDKHSFARNLQQILDLREQYQIATAWQRDIPHVDKNEILAMVHKLPNDQLQVTVLNFSGKAITAKIFPDEFPKNAQLVDMETSTLAAKTDNAGAFTITLQPYGGSFLVIGSK